MATQFDPIAKDESLNTTEVTPRNIADVIAEGLKGIEDALPTYTEGDGIDISAQKVISVDTTFTEASTRANITSGDSLSTIWGKIKKFFTDLKAVAFSGAAADVTYDNTASGLTSTDVQDAIDALNDDLATISGATVVSSKTAYPTYNSACSSGTGTIDQVTCHTLTNGMRVIKGIFNITGDVTGKTILTLPNGYGPYAAGYTQQHWFIITSTSTNLSYIVIGVNNLTAFGTLPPAGIYHIHEVF